jgi:hypothetical protein
MNTLAGRVLEFILGIAPTIAKLFEYVDSGEADPEKELELALDVIREAKREKARRLGLL